MRVLIAFSVAVLSLALPAATWAHGEGGRATGFTSTIESVTPPTEGLELAVLDEDDRLLLRNETGSDVVVLGYDQEPYLLFTEEGVYRNERSPASFLNADRYAQGEVPETVDPEAAPVWRQVASGSSYEWHDHRIQWMSTIAPDAVRADPDSVQHVFDWEVPILVGGDPVEITGSLDYEPVESGPATWVYVAASLPLVAALVAWLIFRHRLRPETAAS